MAPLKAWFCKELGDVVAAHSANEAREVLRHSGANGLGPTDYGDELDESQWVELPDDENLRDEDGKKLGQTVGEAVAELGKPGHLWSCEP
jgi:hypothetical protein